MHRVASIRSLLEGRTAPLRKELTEKMHAAGMAREYERAAEYRDALQALEQIETEQRVVDFDPEVRDYIGFAMREELSAFFVFQMRGGHIVGNSVFHGELPGTEEENMLEFVLRFYSSTAVVPRRLYTSASLGDLSILHRFFKEELHREVEILTPVTTRDAAILRLCTENARQELEKQTQARGDIPGLMELARVLHLETPPLRIEGFDIAHVGGRNTVASLVSFSRGVPDKRAYKRFRITSLPSGRVDDFAAMREVVARRYSRVKNEKLAPPDLVVVDGGKGQVGAAREIMDALNLPVPIVGLAKREEELFLPGESEPIRLPRTNPGLRILQHVRDEAHRFATTYRASLQKKDVVTSSLEDVVGIGPRRAARILRAFPDVHSILETPVDIVARSTGITEELARAVQDKLRNL